MFAAAVIAAVLAGSAATTAAQDRVRLAISAGEQASTAKIKQTETFQQYSEQGSLTLDRTIPKRPFYDGGVAIRVAGGLYLGTTVSLFKSAGNGTVTAQVPHPFFFNQRRTTTGTVAGIDRKETAVHIQALWTTRAAGGIEFTTFGGPSIFQIEQGHVSKLNLTLADEVYPYDTLPVFPGAIAAVVKDKVTGYNAGVDMTWRLAKHFGLGALIRYSHGQKNVTPPGEQAVKIETGGLHAGGGLRAIF